MKPHQDTLSPRMGIFLLFAAVILIMVVDKFNF